MPERGNTGKLGMMKKDRVQFLLEDILEIKYGENRRANRKLASHLVKNIGSVRAIHPLNGFAMGKTLLVIRGAHVPEIKSIVILDSSEDGHFQIDNLQKAARKMG